MLEKVNKYHPDKLADRIAGALLDIAYSVEKAPRVAVEVLLGHGQATIIAESSVTFDKKDVQAIVERIARIDELNFIQVPQDVHLSLNQRDGVHCGDNGVFSAKWNDDYEKATELAMTLGTRFPYDGKYLFDFATGEATICQSNAQNADIEAVPELAVFKALRVNPLGEWTGGPDTDAGCTNRKLGSDQPYCNPNGLHGKDLSKADVSVTIYTNCLSKQNGGAKVTAHCSIGDDAVLVEVEGQDKKYVSFPDIVAFAHNYICDLGGFENFAEYGVI